MTQGFLYPGFDSLNTSGQLTTTQNNGGIFVGTAPVISQNPLVTQLTSPGSFTRSPKNTAGTGDVVVIGGGGGGGRQGGAGGAGGVNFQPNYSLPASAVPVSIGGGGAGSSGAGGSGSPSSFGPISVSGGGGSGGYNGSGQPGGSGGGGGSTPPGAGNSGYGSGTPGQGFPGGIGTARYGAYDNRIGGGGGGAGQAGGQQGWPAPTWPGPGGNKTVFGGPGIRIPTLPTSYADGGWVGGGGCNPYGDPNSGITNQGGGGTQGYYTPPGGKPGTGGGGGSCYNGSSSGGGGGPGSVIVVEQKIGPASAKGVWTLKGQYTARVQNTWPYVTNDIV